MLLDNNYIFRRSTTADKEAIAELINICFGMYPIKFRHATDNLENRYLLVFYKDFNDKQKLIAMSGISDDTVFTGHEIDWTCTHPDFRNKGIMTVLMRCLLNDLQDDLPVYCNCWRLGWKETPNLFSVMNRLGAIEVIHDDEKAVCPYRKECAFCNYRRENCVCYTDLYKLC